MAHIAIIDANIGGLPAAYEIQEILQKDTPGDHRVTVVSNHIKGNTPEKVTTWNAFCLADMGDTGAAFIAVPKIPPRNITWAKKDKWVHWSKAAFEKYFIFNMKRGSHDPLFQKLALKVIGLNRLKDRSEARSCKGSNALAIWLHEHA